MYDKKKHVVAFKLDFLPEFVIYNILMLYIYEDFSLFEWLGTAFELCDVSLLRFNLCQKSPF